MKPLLLSALSLLTLAFISCTHSPKPPSKLTPEPALPPPAIAVSIDSYGLDPHKPLTAIWPDGTIVWSKDQKNGGPPYLTAKIDPTKITTLLTRLDGDGVFKKKPGDLMDIGPDSSYHRIDLARGKQHATLISWHELFERNPNLIATSHGIKSVGNKAEREKLIANDDPSYKAFRALWKDIRTSITRLIPKKGTPYQGNLDWKFPRH